MFSVIKNVFLILTMASVVAVSGNSLVLADQAQELPRADDPSGSITGVPDYQLATLKGSELRLSSLRGKVVVLDFFNAACPHCKQHAPFIADLAKRYHDRGLVVLNLCAHNPYVDRELVEKYASDAGITNDVIWSPMELFSAYMAPDESGRLGVPQTVIFGTDARMAGRFIGWEEGKTGPLIEKAVVRELEKATGSAK